MFVTFRIAVHFGAGKAASNGMGWVAFELQNFPIFYGDVQRTGIRAI
jgi:hypothetical protein